MPRKKDFNFDDMLGTGAPGPSEKAAELGEGTEANVTGDVPPGSAETTIGADAAQETLNTGIQESVNAGAQLPADRGSQDGGSAGSPNGNGDPIAALLAAHAGLRTGSAKKATFDFTPEFARALKRWSVDVDMSMRDLVVKAVAQMIPPEYLQETRKPGTQK